MTEQTEPKSTAVPARIELEDFFEAVTRGVMRALAAQDEVSGYALRVGDNRFGGSALSTLPGTVTIGLIAVPPSPFAGPTDAAVARK